MTTDWILRVGTGKNFCSSSIYNIWGIKSNNACSKNFIKNVKIGDRLWFIQSESCGKIIAVTTYKSYNKRDLGPLINITASNEELGWENNTDDDWDIELHYTDLYNVSKCDLYTNIKGAVSIRFYNEKCKINLPVEYENIVKYSKITLNM